MLTSLARGQSARELTAATLGQELAAALKQLNAWVSHPEQDDDSDPKDHGKLLLFGNKVKAALRDVWKDPGTDVFDIGFVPSPSCSSVFWVLLNI